MEKIATALTSHQSLQDFPHEFPQESPRIPHEFPMNPTPVRPHHPSRTRRRPCHQNSCHLNLAFSQQQSSVVVLLASKMPNKIQAKIQEGIRTIQIPCITLSFFLIIGVLPSFPIHLKKRFAQRFEVQVHRITNRMLITLQGSPKQATCDVRNQIEKPLFEQEKKGRFAHLDFWICLLSMWNFRGCRPLRSSSISDRAPSPMEASSCWVMSKVLQILSSSRIRLAWKTREKKRPGTWKRIEQNHRKMI